MTKVLRADHLSHLSQADEEPANVRKLQVVAPLQMAPISTLSTSQDRKVEEIERPTLKHPVYQLIETLQKTETLNQKAAANFETQSHDLIKEMQEIEAEKMKNLREVAEHTKAKATWSALSTVSQYISGAGSLVLGFACGGIPGGMLMAAGIIGIGERALQDSNLLKIPEKVESGLLYLQTALSFAGGIAAWKTGAMAAAQINGASIQEKLSSILTAASSTLAVAGKIGSSKHEQSLSHILAASKDLETRSFGFNQDLSEQTKLVTHSIERSKDELDAAKKAIKATEVHPIL